MNYKIMAFGPPGMVPAFSDLMGPKFEDEVIYMPGEPRHERYATLFIAALTKLLPTKSLPS